MVMKIGVEIKNLPEILECLYFGLTQTTYLWKTFNMLARWKQFDLLENYLKQPMFNIHTENQDKFIVRAIKMTAFFATMYRTSVGLTIIFFAIFPYIEHTTPLPGWFPINTDKYQFIIYVYQLCALILNGYNHTSLDCINAAMISLASSQFEILKDNLQNVTNDLPKNEKDKNRLITKRLRRNIDHHNMILNFVKEIEEMYSTGIFIQFLCSIIIMCVTGFQMSPKKIQYVTLVLYFFCNLNQVAIYSWFGHDILDKSSGVGEACYMSEWNTLNPNVNKYLFIIMERSKIPTILTAGKFFNLTLGTLMMILRTSYSYLAVLKQMYN
nr:putative odorant receptor 85d [Onthophagus taurus]